MRARRPEWNIHKDGILSEFSVAAKAGEDETESKNAEPKNYHCKEYVGYASGEWLNNRDWAKPQHHRTKVRLWKCPYYVIVR